MAEQSMLRRSLALAVLSIGMATATAAWATHFPPRPFFTVVDPAIGFEPLDGLDTTMLTGVHKGAGYRVEVPENWNGDLVMYAHSFRGLEPELTVSDPRIRRHLIENDYAWAASSYSRNFYDVPTGVKDTRALARRFNSLVGKPDRTYIMGHSMGGHITAVSIEQYPRAYDGAMPMCGVVGDNELFDYFLDFNLVAQALTGVDPGYPADPFTYGVDAGTIFFLLGDSSIPFSFPLTLSPAGLRLKDVTRNISGGPRPLFEEGFLAWNTPTPDLPLPFLLQFGVDDGTVFGSAVGTVAGNIDTVYQFDTGPALSPEEEDLNAIVRRVAPEPNGRHPNGLSDIPAISGDLPVPVITLHTLGDLFVPFSMEQIYAARAAAEGKTGMLVQRAIRDVGHCEFTKSEEAEAFDDLVAWVVDGIVPAGDDVLDPLAVADPDYGCAFTDPAPGPDEDPELAARRGTFPACTP